MISLRNKFKLVGFPDDPLFRLQKILAVVLLSLMILPVFSVQAARRVVRVGIYQNEPKVFLDDQGKADGFFIDLLEEIAKEEGWELTYFPCEWENCLAALETGQIDLMPDVAYTPERDGKYDFHRIPASESWSRVYSSPKVTINRIDQLDGKKIAILGGSIQHDLLHKTLFDYGFEIDEIIAQTPGEVFELVANGSADAAVVSHFFGDYFYLDYGLVRTPVIFNATTLYFATASGRNADLLESIDLHLQVWRDNPNSVYYSLLNQWLDKSNRNIWIKYLTWSVGGIAVLLCLAVFWVFLLRKQVRERTKHLEESNQKLRESEEGYRLISSVTFDYMFSSRVDLNGDLILNWVAGAFERITGYTLEEYIALGGWRATLFPEDVAADEKDMEMLRSNRPVITELRTIKKNGDTSWGRVYAHPIWDHEQNRLVGIYGAVQDITDRKKAELNLFKANSLLNITGEVARVGGWEFNRETKEIIATEEMYSIFEIDSGTRLNIDELIHYFTEESQPVISEAFQSCVQDGISWNLELPMITGKNNRIWVSIQGNPDYESGNIVRLFGAVQDITKRKIAEEKIRMQTSRAEALVQTASHINSRLDLDQVLSSVCYETAHALSVNAAAVHLYNATSNSLMLVADYGLPPIFEEENRCIPLSAYPPEFSPNLDTPVIILDAQNTANLPNRDLLTDLDFRTIVRVKIKNKDTFIGCISIYTIGKIRNFTNDEISLLEGLSNQAAQAITNAHLFENTERKLNNIKALHSIDSAISNSMDIRYTLNVVAEETIDQLGLDAVDILLFNPDRKSLESAVCQGFLTPSMQNISLSVGEGIAGHIAANRKQVFIADMESFQDESFTLPAFLGEDFVSYIGMPLEAKGQLIGIMEIFNRTRLNPDEEWFEFLDTLAGQAAIAIDNIKSFEELQISNTKLVMAYDDTIEGWSRAMDLRDKETEGHTRRVTDLTLTLARKFGIENDRIVHIKRGALLHDMGKLGIPDSILLKPGPLTQEEWGIMKRHPVYAFEMLSSIEYLRPALDIPYCHHEKWDGSGYPRGLKGEEIPIAARIFAVIDVWDALISDRPYRTAWKQEQALEYIQQNTGTHFDPQVVTVFLEELERFNTKS
ncbi:MAG: HD domain-containing phosphohydrolase [Anaerolineaceae bacterium]